MTTRKKTILFGGIAVAGGAVLLATVAMAHGPRQEPVPDFATLDADGDGVLTAEELQSAKADRMGEIDTNGDGFVTVDEMIALMLARNAERIEARFGKMLERADANGDGQLSVDELGEMRGAPGPKLDAAGLPKGWDANGDGVLSEEEFQTAMENRKDRHGKRHHGG
jgi:Ca2+-binding EF-hand superfamily protein